MSSRCGLKWDLLGYCSEPEQLEMIPSWEKLRKYELECKKKDNPEGREMRQRRRTRCYGDGILYF